MLDAWQPPPLTTAELPGIGGRIKQTPQDFEVEEIPAYQPSGEGPFLYLWIEKTGLGAEFLLRTIARQLGIPISEIGCAGLKDRHAVTRQMISVPASTEPLLKELESPNLRILGVSRHTNKLRSGHLHGNRFRVIVRGVCAEAQARLAQLLAAVRKSGIPNYYGPQRFGRGGETATLGLGLLRQAESRTRSQRGRTNPFMRKLALSAAQSVLFNAYLARRFGDGALWRVLSGDVMLKRPSGGIFRADDLHHEQERFDRRETVHAGPIFGRKMFPSAGDAALREAEVLSQAGLPPEAFARFGKLLQGTRRANIVYCDHLDARSCEEGIELRFNLPAGCYATVLLRELMKTDVEDAEAEAGE